jgi:hypothetical protein
VTAGSGVAALRFTAPLLLWLQYVCFPHFSTNVCCQSLYQVGLLGMFALNNGEMQVSLSTCRSPSLASRGAHPTRHPPRRSPVAGELAHV